MEPLWRRSKRCHICPIWTGSIVHSGFVQWLLHISWSGARFSHWLGVRMVDLLIQLLPHWRKNMWPPFSCANAGFYAIKRAQNGLKAHMRTASFLVFTFIKKGLKTTKVKNTACASKKIKTNHQRAFCATHRFLSHP